MKTLLVTIALLLSITAATAHPNHSCHSHNGVARHCR